MITFAPRYTELHIERLKQVLSMIAEHLAHCPLSAEDRRSILMDMRCIELRDAAELVTEQSDVCIPVAEFAQAILLADDMDALGKLLTNERTAAEKFMAKFDLLTGCTQFDKIRRATHPSELFRLEVDHLTESASLSEQHQLVTELAFRRLARVRSTAIADLLTSDQGHTIDQLLEDARERRLVHR